ncbi:hypothetical protein G6F59_014191 [Rhizopus arrhizus]|nr:hypothetical protein G6F59_014191 [Rhizopus arrhizus]
MAAKRLHALFARDALTLVAEDHRVAVEGDAQLPGRSTGVDLVGRRSGSLAGRLGQDGRRCDAMAQCAAHRFRVGRQEQGGAERLHVGPGRLAGGERRADDAQTVMLDRIEDAQAGIGRIARQQDHLDARIFRAGALVQRQQLAHHREGHAGAEDVVLMLALEFGVGRHAIALEQRMAFLEVEQGARGHRDGQQTGGVVAHRWGPSSGRHGRPPIVFKKRTVRSGSGLPGCAPGRTAGLRGGPSTRGWALRPRHGSRASRRSR